MFLVLMVLLFCIGCDQATKWVAKSTLKDSPPKSFLFDTVRLSYTENTGAFLGMGSTMSGSARFWFFIVLPGITICGVLIFALISDKVRRWELVMLSLLLGGGISNLYDRIFQDGRVTDFLNVGIGSLRTGIFNVADVMIMAGALGILLLTFFNKGTADVSKELP